MKVRIKTYEIGQCFACGAKVVAVSNGHKLYETREFPYKFDTQAYRAAKEWALTKGHTVLD